VSQSRRPNKQDSDTIHNIQEQLKPGKKLRDIGTNPAIIDGFIDDLQNIFEALEKSNTGSLPTAQALPNIDSFARSIETINTNISKAIRQLNKAVMKLEEISRIRLEGKNAGKDAIDIDTNQDLFFDHLEQCRQSLIVAEKITGLIGTVPKDQAAGAG
jgi:uncharacterized phage infection (PIP) family protein YhgE